MKVAVVGSGFSGSIVAHELAIHGFEVDLFESRYHIGGNCYTETDCSTGICIHKYGPHIFHTSNAETLRYIEKFGKLAPFINRVKAVSKNKVYSMPVNLHTINAYWGTCFSPSQAEEFIRNNSTNISQPKNFEEQALSMIGPELYQAFFKGYTFKQWGIDPIKLPASILKRIPIRFNYNDNYYNDKYQVIPVNGYTAIFDSMLNHELISVKVSSNFSSCDKDKYEHIFYTGTIDSWFNYIHGRLPYRTLDFKAEEHIGDYQGNPVINYCDADVPWTRITEHKHFAPWQSHEKTIIFKEYSRIMQANDIPYYPIRLAGDIGVLKEYEQLARNEKNVTFLGRLATYRYLDMNICIEEALHVASGFIDTYK